MDQGGLVGVLSTPLQFHPSSGENYPSVGGALRVRRFRVTELLSDLYSLEAPEDFLDSEAQDNRTPVRTGERIATVEQFIDKPLHFFAGQRGVDLDGCTAR
jgi:hypothetical protein